MRRIGFVLILLTGLITACTTALPQPSPTAQATLPGSTASPSSVPAPSETPLPGASSTPTPPPTASLPPTETVPPTSTITPTSILAGLKIQYVEYQSNSLSLSFTVPGIQQAYRLEISGQPYTCAVKPLYPGRMFCSGPYIPSGKAVDLAFYPADTSSSVPLYQMAYVVNPVLTPTLSPEQIASGICPVRGINARCETENRVADNGKCVVSTCVDICGYWYSVDTCIYLTPFEGPKSIHQTQVAALTAQAGKGK